MKSSEETCLIPGPSGPTGWRASGKGKLVGLEVGRMKRADWVALPQKAVITLPARFPAMTADRREAAAQLELETLGLNGLTHDDFDITTHDTDEKEHRATIAIQSAGHSVPPEAGMDSKFAPSVNFRHLEPSEVTLWQEADQWCLAIPSESGKPLHAQALTARSVDEDAAAEIRCVLGALDLLGLTPEVKEVVVERAEGQPPPLGLADLASEVDLPIKTEAVPTPVLPDHNWRLAPTVILQRRKERAQRQAAFLTGLGAVLVILALLGTFAARLWTRERMIAAGTAKLDAMESELATIREAQDRWGVIESALTPDKTPAEIFHQIARLMPPKDMRLSLFKIDGSTVYLSAETKDQTLEGQLRQNLQDSKASCFEGLQWDTPNSRQQPDGRLVFDWQAAPPVTEESQ